MSTENINVVNGNANGVTPTMKLGYRGEKGEKGDTGAAAGFGTATASVDSGVGTPAVTVTTSGPDTAKEFDFAFSNLKGDKGDTGDAAGFGTVSATVDANHGTPAVTVTASGDDTAKNFAFAFSNLQPAPYDDSELQSDFATLQAQFDTAVAAVTVDSEVADIRVGADGVTYNSAGAAVRGQLTDLKAEIDDTKMQIFAVQEGDKRINLNWTSGWCNGSDVTASENGSVVSDIIPITDINYIVNSMSDSVFVRIWRYSYNSSTQSYDYGNYQQTAQNVEKHILNRAFDYVRLGIHRYSNSAYVTQRVIDSVMPFKAYTATPTFEQGNISTSGTRSGSGYYVRSMGLYYFAGSATFNITVGSGEEVFVLHWAGSLSSANYNIIGATKSKVLTIGDNNGNYFGIIIQKTNGTSISPSGITSSVEITADAYNMLSMANEDMTAVIGDSNTFAICDWENGDVYDGGSTGGNAKLLRLKRKPIMQFSDIVSVHIKPSSARQAHLKIWKGTPSLSTLESKTIIDSEITTLITGDDIRIAVLIENKDGTNISTSDNDVVVTISTKAVDILRENADIETGLLDNIGWRTTAEQTASLQHVDGEVENFLYFTDPHLLTGQAGWESKFIQYMDAMQAYYDNCAVNMTLCGGDWLSYENAINTFELCYMRKVAERKLAPFYNVVGNHDMYSGSGQYTPAELRNILFPSKENCYYKFSGTSTQFYALDTGMDSADYAAMTPYRWEQIDWLATQLLTDDKSNSMILMHIYSDDANHETVTPFAQNVVDVCSAYNSRQTVTLNETTYDFTSCNGTMRLIICGHNHSDYALTNSGIPVVCTTNTQKGTPTFDLCCVRYSENKMYMIRVGNGADRTITLA